MKNVTDQIESKINYLSFYTPYVKKIRVTGQDQATGCCPFHHDENPSFSVNISTGQYICFSCQRKGNIYTFLKEKHGLTKKQAIDYLCDYLGIQRQVKKTIPDKTVKEMHKALINEEKALAYLKEKRGLSLKIIKQYKLGFHKGRIAIPIYDDVGDCVNVRLYKPQLKNNKMISWAKEYGSARLFPIENLNSNEILLTEGEMDCLVAIQNGFNAMTVTSGAGTWKPEAWNKLFNNKKVYICYDVDDPGINGAQRVAKSLSGHAAEIKIIYLPLIEPPGADITNYFIDQGYSAEDFRALIDSAPVFRVEGLKQREQEYITVHLADASHNRFYDKNVEMAVMVSGKDLSPYLIPRVAKFFCSGDMAGKRCDFCSVRLSGGVKIVEYEHDDAELLKLIGVSDNELKTLLRRKAGVYPNCAAAQVQVLEALNIEEIRMIPELDFSTDAKPFVDRIGYYVGHGVLPNRSYIVRGVTLPNPRTQHAVHLIRECIPSRNTIDKFAMTPELYERLKIFQHENYELIANDLEHVTGIYGRRDLLFGLDLVWHSVLSFQFQYRYLKKGWLECLVLGDTRTGKTQTVQGLIKHYRAGEFGTGENSTEAGIFGGLQQNAKRWSLTWGKIPLNDRRLYVIDEASGLTKEQIAKLSGVRSEGIAEITKIHTEKTHARTRLIWISNPRYNKSMMQYTYGVRAVKELIGQPEDIARFDFVITCASSDIPPEIYNTSRPAPNDLENLKHNSDLCNALILWVWSRRPDQVKITDKAESLILKYADIQGRKYYEEIPIVTAAEQRIKLAKMAVAVAARFFSTPDGEIIKVMPRHVEMAYQFLEKIYSVKSLRYDKWSETQWKRKTLRDPKKLDEILTDNMADFLMDYEQLRLMDIQSVMDDRKEASQLIRQLIYHRALERSGSSYYRKTEPFIEYLQNRLDKNNSKEINNEEIEIPF